MGLRIGNVLGKIFGSATKEVRASVSTAPRTSSSYSTLHKPSPTISSRWLASITRRFSPFSKHELALPLAQVHPQLFGLFCKIAEGRSELTLAALDAIDRASCGAHILQALRALADTAPQATRHLTQQLIRRSQPDVLFTVIEKMVTNAPNLGNRRTLDEAFERMMGCSSPQEQRAIVVQLKQLLDTAQPVNLEAQFLLGRLQDATRGWLA